MDEGGQKSEVREMGQVQAWKGLVELREQYKKEGNWAEVKKANRRIMEEDQREQCGAVHYYPPRLQIEHSNICNAQCIMCSHFFTQNHKARFADEVFQEKVRPLLPYVEKITLHGVGEPLAHPQIAAFIEWYHSYGIRVTCNTNMAYMDEHLAGAIHQAFQSITISCDGCSKEVYEGIRKGLSFEKMKANARMLRRYGNQLNMRMHTVAMRQNLAELPGIVRLAAELGCCHITIVDMTPQGFLENQKDAPGNYAAVFQKYLQEAAREAERAGIGIAYPQVPVDAKGRGLAWEQKEISRYPLFPSQDFQDRLKEKYRALSLDGNTISALEEDFARASGYRCRGICDYFAEEPYIDLNGDVFLCCVNWLHSLGNLNQLPFEEIWNGRLYQKLRGMFAQGELPKYCKGCIFLRNQMFTPKITVEKMNREFWDSAFDQAVAKVIEERLGGAGG